MTARDIDLDYTDDGATLERAQLTGNGGDQDGGRRRRTGPPVCRRPARADVCAGCVADEGRRARQRPRRSARTAGHSRARSVTGAGVRGDRHGRQGPGCGAVRQRGRVPGGCGRRTGGAGRALERAADRAGGRRGDERDVHRQREVRGPGPAGVWRARRIRSGEGDAAVVGHGRRRGAARGRRADRDRGRSDRRDAPGAPDGGARQRPDDSARGDGEEPAPGAAAAGPARQRQRQRARVRRRRGEGDLHRRRGALAGRDGDSRQHDRAGSNPRRSGGDRRRALDGRARYRHVGRIGQRDPLQRRDAYADVREPAAAEARRSRTDARQRRRTATSPEPGPAPTLPLADERRAGRRHGHPN